MGVRHVVERRNVGPSGLVIDPLRARHCVVEAQRIAILGGEIDPRTHLNLEFDEHGLTECLIADRFAVGSPIEMGAEGWAIARVDPRAYAHLGPVDVDERRSEWLRALERRRKESDGRVAGGGGAGQRPARG